MVPVRAIPASRSGSRYVVKYSWRGKRRKKSLPHADGGQRFKAGHRGRDAAHVGAAFGRLRERWIAHLHRPHPNGV